MSRDLYLDREDIDAIVMALRARVPHYQDTAQKNRANPTTASYALQQRRRIESIAARLSGLGSAIVTERPRR